jgi:hypothetical protein
MYEALAERQNLSLIVTLIVSVGALWLLLGTHLCSRHCSHGLRQVRPSASDFVTDLKSDLRQVQFFRGLRRSSQDLTWLLWVEFEYNAACHELTHDHVSVWFTVRSLTVWPRLDDQGRREDRYQPYFGHIFIREDTLTLLPQRERCVNTSSHQASI